MKLGIHKAEGGLLRISLDADGKIRKITITGDFFFYPEEAIEELERALVGVKVGEEALLESITNFYKEKGIESPGLKPMDFVTAIRKAL